MRTIVASANDPAMIIDQCAALRSAVRSLRAAGNPTTTQAAIGSKAGMATPNLAAASPANAVPN
ncbi:MAG TPA: hypothetical protein VIK01_19425, partial [Polyangiaceae bacterium]